MAGLLAPRPPMLTGYGLISGGKTRPQKGPFKDFFETELLSLSNNDFFNLIKLQQKVALKTS